MRRSLQLVALVAVLGLVAAGCGRGGDGTQEQQQAEVQRGGTLLGGMEADVDEAFDPQKEYYSVTWGFFHCCLLRTLVTTPTLPADEGGNDLVPDLATDLPDVSEDGLTYTFTLKDGVMFGPPLSREITADDVITALEREADPKVTAGYGFYYSVIEGFDDFGAGKADSISGLNAVDDKTLEITLSRPAGDFPFRMTMPAAAPLPAEAVEGHEKDYGRYLVSSGPYMFEGSEDIDFAASPDQGGASGYVPGRSIVFVRNPDWDPETDEVRPAYLDRMEFQIGLTTDDMQDKVAAGELHLNVDGVPPPQVVQGARAENPDLVKVVGADGIDYLSMNVAEPPFDDVFVRKAVNFAIDKASLQQIEGGDIFGEPIGHTIIDPLLDNILADYDPYATPESGGDVDLAKEQMAQSQYDQDGDGVCDDPVCENVVVSLDEADPYPDQARVIQQNLEPLGITLDLNQFDRTTMYDNCNDAGQHVALCPSVGWFKDYADPTTFGEPLFGSAGIWPSCCNYSLVGATEDVLRKYDYDTNIEVPSVDDKIIECDALPVGDERFQCFAELDQTIMEDVVPWVPLSTANEVFVISDQITRWKADQFSSGPAFDQISITQTQA